MGRRGRGGEGVGGICRRGLQTRVRCGLRVVPVDLDRSYRCVDAIRTVGLAVWCFGLLPCLGFLTREGIGRNPFGSVGFLETHWILDFIGNFIVHSFGI